MGAIAQSTTSSSTPLLGLVILACIVICATVWKRKGGSSGVGGLIGWFLGPFGVLIVLLATPKAAKHRVARSVPTKPVPDRPDSIPARPAPNAVAAPHDSAQMNS
jgi:hypothetical protein